MVALGMRLPAFFHRFIATVRLLCVDRLSADQTPETRFERHFLRLFGTKPPPPRVCVMAIAQKILDPATWCHLPSVWMGKRFPAAFLQALPRGLLSENRTQAFQRWRRPQDFQRPVSLT